MERELEPTRAMPTRPMAGLSDQGAPLNEQTLAALRTRWTQYGALDEINRGGMGVIFSATDRLSGREVAIKMIGADVAGDPRIVARFFEEARFTAQLEHPNIVPVYELGQNPEGELYFAMKRVEGRDLLDLLDEHPPLTRLLGVFDKVCDALAFAHSRGIIHRDLKPENVMIGRFGEVLVMDWGLAKLVNAGEDPATPRRQTTQGDLSRTMQGTVMGTLAYMSPEQASGRVDQLDSRSDIYALGALLYELLCGKPPFETPVDGTVEQALKEVREGRFPRPTEIRPAVPRELEAVVLKAMASSPSERYQSVPELQADIEAYLEGRTLQSVSYSPLQRLLKWARRHRTAAGLALLLLLGGPGLLLGLRWQAERMRRQQASELLARAQDLQKASEQVAAREKKLEHLLAAVSHLDRARALHPVSTTIRELRREVGRQLGLAALYGADYTLARQTFTDLRHHGATRQQVSELLARVEHRRTEVQRTRAARLGQIVADLRAGLSRPGRSPDAPTLNDHVFEAVGYRDQQTVDALAAQLRALGEELRARQDASLSDGERELAIFCCRVLGRLRLPGVVAPLAAWLATLRDPTLIVEAGQALCNTREAAAQAPLLRLRTRLGSRSLAWRRIQPLLGRLPVLATQVTTPAGYRARAATREARGDLPGAEADLTAAIRLAPRQPEPYNLRGLLRRRMGERAQALKDFDQAIALSPHPWYFHNRGITRFDGGAVRSALADYDEALRRDPRLVEAYTARANAHRRLGAAGRARADLDTAIRLRPDYALAYNNRGELHRAAGRLDLAVADYNRAIRLEPRMARAYNNRGIIFQARGETTQAADDYSRAIRLNPKMYEAWFNRATLRHAQKRLAGAEQDLNRTLALRPRMLSAFLVRGVVREALGRRKEALEDLDQAHALGPDEPEVLYQRGLLLSRAGAHTRAAADLRRYLRLRPRSTRRPEIERYLEKVGR